MLNKSNYFQIFILAGLLLQSCGPVQGQRRENVAPDTYADRTFANDYFLQDEKCQKSPRKSSISSSPIYVWQGDKTRSIETQFDNVYNSDSLSSNLIANTWFRYHQRKNCTRDENGEVCDSNLEIVHNRTKLRVCGNNDGYKRNSIEAVALTGIANLDQSYSFYSSLGNSKDMQKANLLVLPKIEKKITNNDGRDDESEFTADNLTYTSSFEGAPLFVIYPKSVASVKRGFWKNLNLWEIPWAVAHEFGHHVFWTHSRYASTSNLMKSHEPFVHGFSLSGGMTKIQRAVGEGFADLYAYYTLGGRQGYTDGIECFENDRDIGSDVFIDGTFKALNESVVGEFFKLESSSVTTCLKPNFSEVHALGAVLARGIDQVFEADVGDSAAAKAELLLQWSEKLASSREAGKDGFDIAIKDALNLVSSDSQRVCEVVARYFPYYSEKVLNRYSCNL